MNLKSTIIQGQIPYLMVLKRILFFFAIILPFSIFFMPQEFRQFAEFGWKVLVAVMLIRPLSDIIPDLGILRSMVTFRREFGVFAGLMLLAHFIGFTIVNKMSVVDVVFNSKFWNFNLFITWGLVGVIIALPVILTSNQFSIRLLKKHWKIVQRFAYLLFLCGGIHVYLIKGIDGIIMIVSVAILWLLAHFNFKIKFLKRERV